MEESKKVQGPRLQIFIQCWMFNAKFLIWTCTTYVICVYMQLKYTHTYMYTYYLHNHHTLKSLYCKTITTLIACNNVISKQLWPQQHIFSNCSVDHVQNTQKQKKTKYHKIKHKNFCCNIASTLCWLIKSLWFYCLLSVCYNIYNTTTYLIHLYIYIIYKAVYSYISRNMYVWTLIFTRLHFLGATFWFGILPSNFWGVQ